MSEAQAERDRIAREQREREEQAVGHVSSGSWNHVKNRMEL